MTQKRRCRTPENLVGKVRTNGGQRYVCVGLSSHVCRSGREMMLAVYRSTCAERGCGRPFEVLGPKRLTGRSLNRRCPDHRRPGVSVKVTTASRGRTEAVLNERGPARTAVIEKSRTTQADGNPID